jgi:hypothetical protein
MDSAKCAKCGNEFPTSGMMRLDGQRYCAVCGEQMMEELHRPEPEGAAPAAAGSVCALCGKGGPFQNVGGAALCTTCAHSVYNRDFPKWLKFGLVGALLLLVVALINGEKYFKIGKDLYRGEKLIASGQYDKAEQQLKPVVAFAPDCKKCALLMAKAALLAGDPQAAYDAAGTKKFEEDELFREVSGIFERATKAMQLLKESSDLAEASKRDEALEKLHQAKLAYPEFKAYAAFETGIDESIAFNAKDYDRFLELEEAEAAKSPESPLAVAGVASALACKYAVTGDEKYARDTEDHLQKAQTLSGNDPQSMAAYREYSERIRYRLKSREIIDKTEYDKRFRPELAKKEAK